MRRRATCWKIADVSEELDCLKLECQRVFRGNKQQKTTHLIFDTADKMFLRNGCKVPLDYMTLQPRRKYSSQL
jgi:hypothetical protein